MTNPSIVVVNSAIQQTGVDAGDYKTQLILDTHFHTFDRVTSYAQGGYSFIPAGSSLRRALDAAFSADTVPSIVKVGRSKGTAVYTPVGVSVGAQFGMTLLVKAAGVVTTETETYTVMVSDTAEDIVTALKAQFELVTAITDVVSFTVVGTGSSAVLQISLDNSVNDFSITSLVGNYTLTGITTESAADTLAGVQDFDDEWSWITSTNHTPTYQASLMAVTQTLQYKKYQTSSQLAANYGTWDGASVPSTNDVAAVAAFNQYNRTNVFYHHQADTIYPEMRRITRFALLEPGRSNFQFKPLIGVSLAQIADGSRKLNTQELLNLESKFATTTVKDGGVVFVGGYNGQGNRMANGTRIESVYWTDRAAQKIKQIVLTLLLNSNKMGLNDNDIARVVGSIQTWLTTQVSVLGSTYALDPVRPFKINYPKAKDISFNDKVAGLLQGLSIVAYSDASIDKVIADLTVTFYDPATGE